jgi:hypothetical protein
MRAPSYASDHHRSMASAEPILRWASQRTCFCEVLAAATTYRRSAALVRVPLLADSDPKARSALDIWKEGKMFHHNRRYPAPTEASSGHDLTSVDSSGRPSGVSFSIKRNIPDFATTGNGHTGALPNGVSGLGGGKGRCRTGDAQAQAEGKPAIDRTSRRRVQVVARLVAHSACKRVLPVSPPQKSHI